MARETYKKKITSDEKVSAINKRNIKLKEMFLKAKSRTTSPATIRNYDSDLNIFFVWCLDNIDNKFFVDIKKLEFAEFFSWCVDELKWGSARTNRVRSTLSSLSIFIERFLDEDYPSFRNVILGVIESMPKEERRKKTIMTDEQVDDILRMLENNNAQQACWFSLAVASGARFSELLRFTTDIIDVENRAYDDIFIETLEPIKTKGRGREGKMLHKYIIADIFIPHYEKWLIERSEILNKNGLDHNFLFIKKDGTPATEGTTRSWVSAINRKVDFDFYPHSIRHYLTTFLSKKGIPHQLIRDLFGWESVELVGVYDDSSSKDRKWDELSALKN